jgi:hypothetical protein
MDLPGFFFYSRCQLFGGHPPRGYAWIHTVSFFILVASFLAGTCRGATHGSVRFLFLLTLPAFWRAPAEGLRMDSYSFFFYSRCQLLAGTCRGASPGGRRMVVAAACACVWWRLLVVGTSRARAGWKLLETATSHARAGWELLEAVTLYAFVWWELLETATSYASARRKLSVNTTPHDALQEVLGDDHHRTKRKKEISPSPCEALDWERFFFSFVRHQYSIT